MFRQPGESSSQVGSGQTPVGEKRPLGLAKRIMLLDDDSLFCRQIKRLCKKQQIEVTLCRSLSGFWKRLPVFRSELLAVVADFKFARKIVKSSNFDQIGHLPVLITSSTFLHECDVSDLPILNPSLVHKKYGAAMLVESIVRLEPDRADDATPSLSPS